MFPFRGEMHSVKSLVAGVFDATRHLDEVPINKQVRLAPRASGSSTLPSQFQPPLALNSSNTVILSNYISTCLYSQSNTETPIGCMRINYKLSNVNHISLLAK